MSHDLRPRPKNAAHPSETVIHHYEENQTILARWLQRAMEKGLWFWGTVAGLIAVILAVALLGNWLATGDTATARAWSELTSLRQTPEELLKVAETYPKTKAADWARLQAASRLLNDGASRLGTVPLGDDDTLEKTPEKTVREALELFEQVRDRAQTSGDADLQRFATMGIARARESLGEIKPAIETYLSVKTNWPNTPEAKEAARLAERLDRPESIAFYEKLATFEPKSLADPGSFSPESSLLDPGATRPLSDLVPSSPFGDLGLPEALPDEPPTPPVTEPPTAPPVSDPLPTLPANPFATPAEKDEDSPDAPSAPPQ